MKKSGLRALYAGKRTSIPAKGHARHPYLLRGKAIWLPNQVWATDITYIKLKGGYVYLAAIIDLYSRKVLSWRISNTMDAEFCVAALEEAIAIRRPLPCSASVAVSGSAAEWETSGELDVSPAASRGGVTPGTERAVRSPPSTTRPPATVVCLKKLVKPSKRAL